MFRVLSSFSFRDCNPFQRCFVHGKGSSAQGELTVGNPLVKAVGIDALRIPRCYPVLSVADADGLSENVIGVGRIPFSWVTLDVGSMSYKLPVLGPEIPKEVMGLFTQSGLSRLPSTLPIVQTQIQLTSPSPVFPLAALEDLCQIHRVTWDAVAKAASGGMVARGGGPCGLRVQALPSLSGVAGSMAVLTLDVNVCDAMGANCVNAIAEALSVEMAKVLPPEMRIGMRVLTNASTQRRVSLCWDFPDSADMRACKNNWEALSPAERLYPFAKAMADMAKVTANDTRAVVAALAYEQHVLGQLPLAFVQTETGFQIQVSAPAPFGSVGRVLAFPATKEALSQMGVKKAEDIAFHAAVLGVLETLSYLRQLYASDQRSMQSMASNLRVAGGSRNTAIRAKIYEMDVFGRRDVLRETLGAVDFADLDMTGPAAVPTLAFPVGLLPNPLIDGFPYALAMTEEASVVAGTSFGLKLLGHGFSATVTPCACPPQNRVKHTIEERGNGRRSERHGDWVEVALAAHIPASALMRGEAYPGDYVRDAVVGACHFATLCPERAVTNNKGFDNGMSAAALALGWDDTLLALAMHTSAVRPSGTYGPIVTWTVGASGELVGRCALVVPTEISRGTVVSCENLAQRCLPHTFEDRLSAVVAAGMAVHLASLISLVTKGIQANHMRFHSR